MKKIKRRKIKYSAYNVWKAPYNALYKATEKYALEHGLNPFDKIENPSQDDIDDLRRLQKERVREEREKRRTSYYQKACEALDKLITEALGEASNEWENLKATHAQETVEQAKQINKNDEQWGQYILSHVSDLKNALERFIFLSKQTWDINNPHESTEWWDALEQIIFDW